jgi:hypothetical protein
MEDPVECANSAVDVVADVLEGADDLDTQFATALWWRMPASAAVTLGRGSLGGFAPGRAPNVDRRYEMPLISTIWRSISGRLTS